MRFAPLGWIVGGIVALLAGMVVGPAWGQGPAPGNLAGVKSLPDAYALRPERVFDGVAPEAHRDWVVVVRAGRIVAAGPQAATPTADLPVIDLPGLTLMPGLIDAHSHILLHDYSEAEWDDQVLKESLALRICRATRHLAIDLHHGFTTLRDLGTEGAGYADVGIRDAVDQGIVPGPRLLVATRAIVATKSYAPSRFAPEWTIPQGAEEADGATLQRVVRDQIGRGADLIKIYADNGKGPTFSEDEIRLVVETARSQGRPVAAHATTAEGMRRAARAGVSTIEHGNGGTPEVFALMAERRVAWCPTLTVYEASARRAGRRPDPTGDSPRERQARQAFRAALDAKVTIINGSDVGAFHHGDQARELELMTEYGMTPSQTLSAATAIAADVIGLKTKVGRVAGELEADLVAVAGDPTTDIRAVREVRWVIRHGSVVRRDEPAR